MTSKEITDYLKLITEEGFSKAMKEIDENDSLGTRRIKYYKAISNGTGNAYPPPLLIEKAYEHSTNEKLSDGFFKGIGKESVHFKFLRENGFELLENISENAQNNMKNRTVVIKKVPGNEVGSGTEIGVLKSYWATENVIQDPKTSQNYTVSDNGSRFYKINFKYRKNDYVYQMKAYPTSNWGKDRRFIINSSDPIFNDRKEDDFLCFCFENKIDSESKVIGEVISKDNPIYNTISQSYKTRKGLILKDPSNTDLIDKIFGNNNKVNMQPLNQILYGPPGTGKTYSTITKALDIIGVEYADYKEAQELFQNELGKRIEFVTMHQSFSYEDFVQGLKPKKGEKGIEFDYKNGVFKEICRRADDTITGDSEIDFSTLSNKEVCIIAFFLSKYNGKRKGEKKANEFLGYKSDSFAFYGIGEKVGHKPNSIKNHRDKFDFMFKNRDGYTARNGWIPRNDDGVLDNTDKWPYKKVYDELNPLEFEDLSAIVQKLLSKTKAIEVPAEVNLNHVIILDEINRANISRVFGELIALIEEDKRDGLLTATLPSGEPFTVPSNLHIIGTMNTADKSIALVDIALRRRFKFVPMYPKTDILEEVLRGMELSEDEINLRVHVLETLNRVIRSKKSVDFEIGHSYFMSNDNLVDIMNDQILPLLNEYFMYDLRVVKELLEKQQKDKDGNKIPRIGISLDPDEFKERGLLKVVSVTEIVETPDGAQDDESDSPGDDV